MDQHSFQYLTADKSVKLRGTANCCVGLYWISARAPGPAGIWHFFQIRQKSAPAPTKIPPELDSVAGFEKLIFPTH